MKWPERGFTLVETIVTMAVLMGVVLAGFTMMDIQRNARKTRSGQTMYRYLAIQTAAAVTGSSQNFPPMAFGSAWNDSSDIVIYVGCFNANGELIPNDTGSRDFVFHQQRRARMDREESTGRCVRPTRGSPLAYEVRFWYSNPATREVVVEILDLVIANSRHGRANPKHRFTIFR